MIGRGGGGCKIVHGLGRGSFDFTRYRASKLRVSFYTV